MTATAVPAALRGRVLLVDDEPALVRAFGRVLQRAGFEVVSATDATSALAAFQSGPFACIVTDIMMPGISGLELLKRIRQLDLDVPVILVTAGPTVETAQRAMELGALRYLTKPVDIETLERTVVQAASLGELARRRRQALDVLKEGGQLVGDSTPSQVRFQSALDQLWMAYQPIVRLSTREVFAYEALVRSREAAIPHPGALFDAAEHLGRLRDLGRAIRARAPEPVARLPEGALLFVNLHTKDLEDDELFLDGPLTEVAKQVVLEVTERASLEGIRDLGERMRALRALGYRIALDDLGAGYAGFASFALLEPEVVKIDMSLIRDIHREPVKQKLVASTLSLCRSMNQLVVAEGVETVDELRCLTDLGCDVFQGYLFARPAPAFGTVTWPDAPPGLTR